MTNNISNGFQYMTKMCISEKGNFPKVFKINFSIHTQDSCDESMSHCREMQSKTWILISNVTLQKIVKDVYLWQKCIACKWNKSLLFGHVLKVCIIAFLEKGTFVFLVRSLSRSTVLYGGDGLDWTGKPFKSNFSFYCALHHW